MSKRPPGDELHDDERTGVAVADIEHRDDVGMIERGGRLRFAREPAHGGRIARRIRGDDLQRDVALERGVPGAIHLAHPTAAQTGDDVIATDLDAGFKRQTDLV